MKCPNCQTEMKLEPQVEEPARGIPLTPKLFLVLTCPKCGYSQAETKVLHQEDESGEVIQFRAQKEKEMKEGQLKELNKELENLRGYLDLVKGGEVADTLPNLQLMSQKEKVLSELLNKDMKTKQ